MGIELEPHEMLEVFGEQDPTQYAAEAEQRWGDTEAYRQSQQRTDLVQAEPELAVGEHALQPAEVVGAVDAVPGSRAAAGHQQPDLLPVVERAHGDARRRSDLPHRPRAHETEAAA